VSKLARWLTALFLFLSLGVQAQEVPNYRDRYQLGLVHLTVNGVDPATGHPVDERKGSAFFITDDGRMLSSKHLFVGQDGRRLNQMTIVGRLGSHRGRPFDIVANASLPRLHPEFDVAMLTTDDPALGQRAVPLCFDRPPQVGHRVVALGFPRGEDYDQTDGTIRSTSPTFAETWLTNADLNPGNSGGPVLSLGGSVVAIVIGGFREGDIQGQNAVLPLRVARQFIDQVVELEQKCGSVVEVACGVGAPEGVARSRSGRTIFVEPYRFPSSGPASNVATNLNRIRIESLAVAIGPRLDGMDLQEVSFVATDLGVSVADVDRVRMLGCSLNALAIVGGLGSVQGNPNGEQQQVHLRSAFVLPMDARLRNGARWVEDQMDASDASDPLAFSQRLNARWLFFTLLAAAEKDLRFAETSDARARAVEWVSAAATTRSSREEREQLLALVRSAAASPR
jgi:hypothetical protein